MVVNFSTVDMKDRPTLILKNAGGTPLGVLGYATNVTLDAKYNEVSVIEFELPAYVDGIEVPYYDDVIGMRIIELKDVGQFTLINPVETGEGVKRMKACKANSLEYEFAYKKITIPNGTYKFYDGTNRQDTILGMILELMPSWHVGSIANSLWNKYRTFDESNENVYNFIKGTVQETFNCIFDFDTMQRLIYVRDVSENAESKPVFISNDNLATRIELTENTEDIITRIDVNGAEGVDIRDVNPTGTNKIIMLDYFMNEKNFSSALITKYNTWKALVDSNRTNFYNLNIQYTLATMEKVAEEAKLVDLQGELTSLENVLAVTIQAVARGLETQAALDTANANIRAKESEISSQKTKISGIETKISTLNTQLVSITNTCSFEDYFTSAELIELDRYIKDEEITESSFVSSTTATYTDPGIGSDISDVTFTLTDSAIEVISSTNGAIYDISGGSLSINGLTSECITAVCERKNTGEITITAYLGKGSYGNTLSFGTGCLSVTGDSTTFTQSTTSMSCHITGYMYFTMDASEYEKRSISWELYEYGLDVIRRLAYPSYTFSVDSANFFALDEFEYFKNNISLGQKVYVQISDDRVIEPICIGVKFNYGDLKTLELQFSDSFVSGDNEFRLVDLLDKSVSMGKNVDVSRYIYSSFIDSGASNGIRDFMNSALDTAKNAILSSTDQAITWDGAGFRLRKYSNQEHTAYEPEQIWMNNNSIVMTDDNWATAKMAIGKFHDENLGDCWGIVAPMIVGTILAGERLMIESSKKDGGVSVFTVDEDGCRLYNSDFEVSRTVGANRTQIILSPDIGIAIGSYPLYTVNETTGVKTLNTDNAKFYADDLGNLYLTGHLTATSLHIGTGDNVEDIEDYVTDICDEITDDMKEQLIDRIDGSMTIYYSGTEPSNPEARDIWYNTSTNRIYRRNDDNTAWYEITDSQLGNTLRAIGDAQAIADLKIRTYAMDEPPTPQSVGVDAFDEGDLWIDTNDNNKMYRWNSILSRWVSVQDSHLDFLIDPEDGVTTTYYGPTTPGNPDVGDIWYDTTNHLIKRYDGTNWVDITNEALKAALDAAGTAQAIADGKIKTYSCPRSGLPVGVEFDVGDLWIDTEHNNKLYRWNGTSWVNNADAHLDYLIDTDGVTTIYYDTTAPSSPSLNDIWYNTNTNEIKKYNGTSWVLVQNSPLNNLLNKVNTAQSTADGKIKTYAQTATPSGSSFDIGDLWIDTDDNNKLYRWNGTSWVAMQDTHLDNALSELETRVNNLPVPQKTFIQNSVPTSGTYRRGDVWINTTMGKDTQYLCVSTNWGDIHDWVLVSAGYIYGASLDIDPDSGSITIAAGKTVTIASSGTLSLAGTHVTVGGSTSLNIASGGNLNIYGAGTLNITGGDVQIDGSSSISMASGGTFQVFATSDDSFIKFGGTLSNPNFLLGEGGSIKAKSISVDEITVNSSGTAIPYITSGSLANKIYVGATQPPSGYNTIWFEPITSPSPTPPSGSTTLSYSLTPGQKTYGGNGTYSHTLVLTSGDSLATGTSYTYEVQFRIFIYSGSAIWQNVTIAIVDENDNNLLQIYNGQPYNYHKKAGDYIEFGWYKSSYVTARVNSNTNYGSSTSVRLKISATIEGSQSARIEYEPVILRCTSDGVSSSSTTQTSSSSTAQQCNVYYVP